MKKSFLIVIAIAALCAVISAAAFNNQLKQERSELAALKIRIEAVDKEIAQTREDLSGLEQQNEDLEIKVSDFQNKINIYNTQAADLKNKKEQLFNALRAKRAELVTVKEELENLAKEKGALSTKFNEISAKNKSADEDVVRLGEDKRQIEEEIKKYIKPGEGVELDKIIVKLSEPAEGNIMEINDKYGFIITDIGSDNGIIVGDILGVYRSSRLISKVIVEKVYKDMSSAVPTEGYTNAELKMSDKVSLIR